MNTTIKNTPKILMLLLTIFTISITTSCSEDGADGADGTNGIDGNANVIYSPWTDQNWTDFDTPTIKRMTISAPQITSQITNTGVVLAYFRFSDQTVVRQVPFTEGAAINIRRSFFINVGSISFLISRVDPSFAMSEANVNGSNGSIPQYRYIIIPSSTPLSARGVTPIDYTTMSYSEVCASLNIPE